MGKFSGSYLAALSQNFTYQEKKKLYVKSCNILAGGVGWWARVSEADLEAATFNRPRQMNINERASKAEILSAAVELTDSQAEQIAALTEQRTVLFVLLGVLAVLQLL